MPRYRKKPLVIEAVQILAVDWNGQEFDSFPFSENPCWLTRAIREEKIVPYGDDRDYALWQVTTLEGRVLNAEPGEWIIRGLAGEFYPCKPEIFAATYEPVEEVMPIDDTDQSIVTPPPGA